MKVLPIPKGTSCEEMQGLRDQFREVMPDTKILVLQEGMKLETIKPCRRAKPKPSLLKRRLR